MRNSSMPWPTHVLKHGSTRSGIRAVRWKKPPPMLIVGGLMLSILPSCALVRDNPALPDQTIPHRLSRPVNAMIWVRSPAGDFIEQTATLPAGWWIAAPQVVEKPRP